MRISSRKVKIVIDLIRGKNVDEALAILMYTPKAASPVVHKLLSSAIANAVNNNEMDRKALYVAEVYANPGPTLKRYVARSRGSASPILKRTSHISVVAKSNPKEVSHGSANPVLALASSSTRHPLVHGKKDSRQLVEDYKLRQLLKEKYYRHQPHRHRAQLGRIRLSSPASPA